MARRARFSGIPPTLASIVSVVNNLDTTYTVTIDHPLTLVDPLTSDPNVMIYTPFSNIWQAMQPTGPFTMFSFECQSRFLETDCTRFVIVDTPIAIATALPFDLQQGFVAIM